MNWTVVIEMCYIGIEMCYVGIEMCYIGMTDNEYKMKLSKSILHYTK